MADETRFTGSSFVGGNWINGFGVAFKLQQDTCVAHYTFKDHQQGPRDIAHGGAIAALIDEAMTATVYKMGYGPAFTVNMNISYRAPIYVGEQVSILSKFLQIEGRKILLRAQIHLPDTTLATEADGIFVRMLEDV